MVYITKSDKAIMAVGHAKTKEINNLLDGLIIGLTVGLDRILESEVYELSDGFLHIDIDEIKTDIAFLLCEVFIDSVCQLCVDYPEDFTLNII